MDLTKVKTIYFLGIGGIGMSALARYFKHRGVAIYGYDLTASPLTRRLETEGMKIHYQSNLDAIPAGPDLVIYTPAIPADDPEFVHLKSSGTPMYKRSEIAGKISANYFTIAVAGTHGKTSISALTAHLLEQAGKNITALVGGIMKNYDSNVVISDKADYFIIEADEYDRSFLQLHPNVAVISSMDSDHLDVYGNHDKLNEGYGLFASQLKDDGLLIVNEKLPDFKQHTIRYGFGERADVKATNIHVANGKFVFDLVYETQTIHKIEMAIPGHHYIENALAAATIGFKLNLTTKQIKAGLESFAGVERRFEFRLNEGGKVYIDDYAHHPEEIRATLRAIRTLFPGKRITGVFQPHLFSRTRDFASEFSESLETLDEIILLPIYPAREKPIEGVTSEIILDKIKNKSKRIVNKNNLINHLKNINIEVLVTMGAGDIGLLPPKIEKILK